VDHAKVSNNTSVPVKRILTDVLLPDEKNYVSVMYINDRKITYILLPTELRFHFCKSKKQYYRIVDAIIGSARSIFIRFLGYVGDVGFNPA